MVNLSLPVKERVYKLLIVDQGKRCAADCSALLHILPGIVPSSSLARDAAKELRLVISFFRHQVITSVEIEADLRHSHNSLSL